MKTQNVVKHSLGLLLGTEAPVMTPSGIDFFFSFLFRQTQELHDMSVSAIK